MLRIYTVHDVASKHYGSFHTARTDDEATRSFASVINQEGTMMYGSPEDFTLFCIGEFDQETGEVIPCHPMRVVNGVDVQTKTPTFLRDQAPGGTTDA